MRRTSRWLAGALLVLGGVASPVAASPAPAQPTGVIAIVDTGINPYHQVFRDTSRQAYQHPSTRFPGYPRNAEALRLTLDVESYADAVAADCERVWKKVKLGTLYWVPGTTIVGLIGFEPSVAPKCGTRPTGIQGLDVNGHGTMTATRAVGRTHGACRGCPVVAVQGLNTDSIRWTGAQRGWLDAESNSWGPFVPVWTPTLPKPPVYTGPLVSDAEFVRTVEAGAQGHLSFWASGNGIGTRFGVLGHPTQIDPRITPSVLSVGAHDSGRVVTWADAPPLLASDGCKSWTASHTSTTLEGPTAGAGTSSASPYAAGGALRMLIDARRLLGDTRTGVRGAGPEAIVAEGRAPARSGPLSDGRFTLSEWRRLVLATASERPAAQPDDGPACEAPGGTVASATPMAWRDVPASFPEHLVIGYGAVDAPAWARAADVLRGKAALPDRADTDEYFAKESVLRGALHQVFRGP